jgi:DNA polymerase-3 subunit gamma/tau
VPATILSRCQRFDFRPLASGDIAENLRKITDEEKFEVSDEALGMIARYADGSMRDAQVILDQVTSFGRGKAKAQDVTDILGIVDDEVLFGLSGAIALRDAPRALAIIDRMADEGKDHAQVALGLIEHFRNIAVAKISPEADSLIDAGPDKVKRYRTEAERFTLEEALYVIYALSNTVDMIRRTTLGRIPLEAALIKLTKIPSVIPLGEMLSRIEALESQAGTAAGPGAQRAAMPARAEERASPAPGKPPAAGPAEPVPAPAADAGPSLELEEMSGYWAKVVSYIKPKKMSIASYLEEGSPVAIGPGSLTVGFPKECQFHKDALDSPENKRLIEEAVREVTGLELKVTLTVTGPAVARRGGETAGTRQEPEAGSSGADETDPVIRAALDIFGGKISGANGGGSAR